MRFPTPAAGLALLALLSIAVAPASSQDAWTTPGHDPAFTYRTSALGPAQPTVRWKFQTLSYPSKPLVDRAGLCYVIDGARLYILDTAGQVSWKTVLPEDGSSPVAIDADGTLWLSSGTRIRADHSVATLSREEIARVSIPGADQLTPQQLSDLLANPATILSGPLLIGVGRAGVKYFASREKLVAMSADLTTCLWRWTPTNRSDLPDSIAELEGVLIGWVESGFANYRSLRIGDHEPQTGRRSWTQIVQAWAVGLNDTVWLQQETKLRAVSADGRPVGEFEVTDRKKGRPLITHAGLIVLPLVLSADLLHWFSLVRAYQPPGAFAWQTDAVQPGEEGCDCLGVDGADTVYVVHNSIQLPWQASGARLQAISRTGVELWSLSLPAVLDGFAIGPDGTLFLALEREVWAVGPGQTTPLPPAGPTAVIQGIQPAEGPPGTSVVVTGTGIDPEAVKVLVDGKEAPALATSAVQALVRIPRDAKAGKVAVALSQGGAVCAPAVFEVTAAPPTCAPLAIGNVAPGGGVPGDVAPKPGTDNRPYGDGKVTVSDVIRLLRRAVGMIPDADWP